MYELLLELKERVYQIGMVGTGMIQGDFRLQKLAQKLQALSSKAPVLAKLYDLVSKLLAGENVYEHFMELACLVDAILATQGNSKVVGEEKPLVVYETGQKPFLSYRRLKRIRDIFDGKAGMKWPSLKVVYDVGGVNDPRLLSMYLGNLSDRYVYTFDVKAQPLSICDFLIQYGTAVVPVLLENFKDYNASEKVNAIRIINGVGGTAYNELYKTWAQEEKDESVIIESLRMLSQSLENESFLLDFKTRRKHVQNARIMALAMLVKLKGRQEGDVLVLNDEVYDSELENMILETAKKVNYKK